MKCSGGTPCTECRGSGYDCSYSVSNRIGRPKGTKNKRTLVRVNRKKGDGDKADTDQGSPTHPQTWLTALSNGTGNGMTPENSASIDPMLSTTMDGSNSLAQFEKFCSFSGDLSSWYDIGDLASTSPFTPQPLTTDGLSTENKNPFPEEDSSHVSSTSLFDDKGIFDPAPDFDGLVNDMDGEAERPQEITTSTSPLSLASSITCNCVQNHAELLCRLKELDQRHTQPRLDVVLSSAQQTLVPWKSVVECRVCVHDDSQEVLILSAMSIRTVLRSLRGLCYEYYTSVVYGKESSSEQSTVVGDDQDGMQSAFGMYKITEEERMAVKDLLMSRTLDKIKYTLACFKERLNTSSVNMRARAMPTPPTSPIRSHLSNDVERLHKGGPGDYDHLLQVWRNLDDTVQDLERVLKSGTLILIDDNCCHESVN